MEGRDLSNATEGKTPPGKMRKTEKMWKTEDQASFRGFVVRNNSLFWTQISLLTQLLSFGLDPLIWSFEVNKCKTQLSMQVFPSSYDTV